MSTTSAVTTTVVFLFSFTTTATTHCLSMRQACPIVFHNHRHDTLSFNAPGMTLLVGYLCDLNVVCVAHLLHPPSMSRAFHKILIERYRSFRPALPHLVKRFIHYVKTMYTNYDSLVKTRFLANEEQLRNIMIQHTAQLRLKVRDNARWCALCVAVKEKARWCGLCVAVKEKARWRGICACVELLN
jgi:hypothetical protein